MKVLVISDDVVDTVYSPAIRSRYGDVEMVLSCGDLPYCYMEYVASMLNVPCFYVHGNHDRPEHRADGRTVNEPGGWVNVGGRTVASKGVLLAGFEGSMRYRPDAPYQYTEAEIAFKMWRMTPALLKNRVFHGRYLDVLITHAPPLGIHDGADLAHRGFKSFLTFMTRFRPHYLLHGHRHLYRKRQESTRYIDTEVINVFPCRKIEWTGADESETKGGRPGDDGGR